MNVPDHKSRLHAIWSASATARNTTCAGAIAMATLAGANRESEPAAWGTACHQIAEGCLREGLDASTTIGSTQKTENFMFVVDEEMVNCSQEFIDYCLGRVEKYSNETGGSVEHWIEENFSLDGISPPFDAGGTGDFIVYFPLWKMLEIVDLKGGKGVVVEVKGNAQARTYALGAMLAFPDLDVEIVRSTIVQPRAPHADGRIRSEEIHVADLIDWTAWLLTKMRQSKAALDSFPGLPGMKEWGEQWLKTGACTFCPAEGYCPARKAEALAAAGAKAVAWFEDPDAAGLPIVPEPKLIPTAELGHVLDGLEALENWIKALRSHALSRAEKGEDIPGWVLTDKIGNRAWMYDDAKLATRIKDALGLTDKEVLSEPEVKSVAQLEKTLGKRKSDLAALEGSLWHKPKKGVNLVSRDKTTRAPAKSKPEQYFEQIETEKQ